MIKHSPEIIYQQIAKIYDITAETANHPAELTHGLLAPLQKPGKSRGPPANLRPIILLSNLRKILAACMMKRIEHKIDKEIPITQAAYRQKRSTTEHIFSTKTVIERTISAKNETVYLILLDMSKAFDSINRKVLIDDLRPIINHDELHIIKLLLNVKLAVKCGNETSDFFDTDTGTPQGNCGSATEFTFYLARSIPSSMLNNTPEINNHNYYQPNIQSSIPDHLTEHNYCKIPSTKILDIDQHYADDISKITSSKSNIDKMKSELPTVLKSRQLIINDSKTEEYIVSKRNHDWRTYKLLGSLLDTERDIERRKNLAINSAIRLKFLFFNKNITIKTKLQLLSTYVQPIFLYNAELWTLTKTLNEKVDTFQRRLLRTYVHNIKWPDKISNNDLYEKSNVVIWSKHIRIRRLKWFGKLSRLDVATPARQALEYALEPFQRPRGRPPLTWISLVTQELKRDLKLNWNDAFNLAKDEKSWKKIIDDTYSGHVN